MCIWKPNLQFFLKKTFHNQEVVSLASLYYSHSQLIHNFATSDNCWPCSKVKFNKAVTNHCCMRKAVFAPRYLGVAAEVLLMHKTEKNLLEEIFFKAVSNSLGYPPPLKCHFRSKFRLFNFNATIKFEIFSLYCCLNPFIVSFRSLKIT